MYGYSTIYGTPALGAWYDDLNPLTWASRAASSATQYVKDSALSALAPSTLAEMERLRAEKAAAEASARSTKLVAGGAALLVVGGLLAYGVGRRRRR